MTSSIMLCIIIGALIFLAAIKKKRHICCRPNPIQPKHKKKTRGVVYLIDRHNGTVNWVCCHTPRSSVRTEQKQNRSNTMDSSSSSRKPAARRRVKISSRPQRIQVQNPPELTRPFIVKGQTTAEERMELAIRMGGAGAMNRESAKEAKRYGAKECIAEVDEGNGMKKKIFSHEERGWSSNGATNSKNTSTAYRYSVLPTHVERSSLRKVAKTHGRIDVHNELITGQLTEAQANAQLFDQELEDAMKYGGYYDVHKDMVAVREPDEWEVEQIDEAIDNVAGTIGTGETVKRREPIRYSIDDVVSSAIATSSLATIHTVVAERKRGPKKPQPSSSSNAKQSNGELKDDDHGQSAEVPHETQTESLASKSRVLRQRYGPSVRFLAPTICPRIIYGEPYVNTFLKYWNNELAKEFMDRPVRPLSVFIKELRHHSGGVLENISAYDHKKIPNTRLGQSGCPPEWIADGRCVVLRTKFNDYALSHQMDLNRSSAKEIGKVVNSETLSGFFQDFMKVFVYLVVLPPSIGLGNDAPSRAGIPDKQTTGSVGSSVPCAVSCVSKESLLKPHESQDGVVLLDFFFSIATDNADADSFIGA